MLKDGCPSFLVFFFLWRRDTILSRLFPYSDNCVTVAAVPIDLWATTSQKGDGNQNFRCRFFLLLPFPSGSFYFIFVFQCYVEYAQLKKKKKCLWAKCPWWHQTSSVAAATDGHLRVCVNLTLNCCSSAPDYLNKNSWWLSIRLLNIFKGEMLRKSLAQTLHWSFPLDIARRFIFLRWKKMSPPEHTKGHPRSTSFRLYHTHTHTHTPDGVGRDICSELEFLFQPFTCDQVAHYHQISFSYTSIPLYGLYGYKKERRRIYSISGGFHIFFFFFFFLPGHITFFFFLPKKKCSKKYIVLMEFPLPRKDLKKNENKKNIEGAPSSLVVGPDLLVLRCYKDKSIGGGGLEESPTHGNKLSFPPFFFFLWLVDTRLFLLRVSPLPWKFFRFLFL